MAQENEKRELRAVSSPVEIREEGEKRLVEGYAALFETPSDRLDFEERIQEGAFDGVIERSDVMALLNHSTIRGILARCKRGVGSLSLAIDKKGLRYSFEAPKTALGDELIEGIKRGDISESSFAFDVEKDHWEKDKANGVWKRTIIQIGNLYDVSPVYTAAYSQTSVYMRGKEEAEKALEEAERRANEMPDSYYEQLRKEYNL